ncbi:cytochrome P450 [Circinella umbellata]|nr:cytochrome P450 [Circinella umbellata]
MNFYKWLVFLLNYQRQRRSECILITVVLASSYSLYRQWIERKTLKRDCPTVPYINPFVGSTLEYRRNPRAFVEKYSALMGPVFRCHIFGSLHTIVSGSYVREILFNKNFSFEDGTSKRFDVALLIGMTKTEGITLADLRTVIVKSVTVHMKEYTPRVVHYLDVGLREAVGDLAEPKELPNLFSMVQHMIAKASASIFVGLELCENENLVEAFREVTTDVGLSFRMDNVWLDRFITLNKFRMWYIGKFSSLIQSRKSQIIEALKPVIDKRMEGIATKDSSDTTWTRPNDILQYIIEDHPLPPNNKTDKYTYFAHWMIVLVFVSVFTTSEHATIVLYRILQHPETIDELIKEQKEIYGDDIILNKNNKSEDVFTADSVKKLTKLDSLCREALRSKNEYFQLPHTNISKQNITLSNGVIIPPNHDVLVNFWANHHDEELQRDTIGNYDKFEPFRYVGMGRPSTKVGDDYLVFGEGKHACPGRWFALQEIKTIVSLLIRDYTLKPSGPIEFPTDVKTGVPSGKVIIQRKM